MPTASNSDNPIIQFLSTRSGLSVTLITAGVSVLMPIFTHIWTHKRAYEEGQQDYVEALKDGRAELDGQIIQVITHAEKAALADQARIAGEADGFQRAQSEFTTTLRGIYDQHSRDLARLAQREHTQEELDWRRLDVPHSTSLRLDRAIAARQTGDHSTRLSEAGDRDKLAGYPPINAD